MKKLVKINSSNDRYVDIDTNKLCREALDLIKYIRKNYSAANDDHGIIGSFLPLCEQAANKQINKAVPLNSLPLRYERRERVFPPELNTLMARFCVTISGTPLDVVAVHYINGEPYTYVDFE